MYRTNYQCSVGFDTGAKHLVEAVQEHKVQVTKKNGQQDGLSEIPD